MTDIPAIPIQTILQYCFQAQKSYIRKERTYGKVIHDMFIGKLGEYVVSTALNNVGIKCTGPDLSIQHVADSGDLRLLDTNQIISVKTIHEPPNYTKLLNQVSHFDGTGKYICGFTPVTLAYHICVRLTIGDTEKILSKYDDDSIGLHPDIRYYLNCQILSDIISHRWQYKIEGFATHLEFLKTIQSRRIVEYKGNQCYYIPVNKLHPLYEIGIDIKNNTGA